MKNHTFSVVFTDFFYLFECVCLGGNECFVLECEIVFSWKTVCECVCVRVLVIAGA